MPPKNHVKIQKARPDPQHGDAVDGSSNSQALSSKTLGGGGVQPRGMRPQNNRGEPILRPSKPERPSPKSLKPPSPVPPIHLPPGTNALRPHGRAGPRGQVRPGGRSTWSDNLSHQGHHPPTGRPRAPYRPDHDGFNYMMHWSERSMGHDGRNMIHHPQPHMLQPTFFTYGPPPGVQFPVYHSSQQHPSHSNQPPPPNERRIRPSDGGQYSRRHSEEVPPSSHQLELANLLTGIQGLFPKLNSILLRLAVAILVENLSAHSEAKNAGFVNATDIKEAQKVLQQDPEKAKSIITKTFKAIEKGYLSGAELRTYGGEPIVGSSERIYEVPAREVEWGVRYLLTDPLVMLPSADSSASAQKASDARKSATKVPFPQVAAEFLVEEELFKLHLDAFQNLSDLLTTPSGFVDLSDVAFGLVTLTPEGKKISHHDTQNGMRLSTITKLMKGQEKTQELSPTKPEFDKQQSAAMRFRSIRLTATAGTSTLIDVRTYPQFPSRFAIIDDSGFARSGFDGIEKAEGAIKFSPGEDYDLTLILDTRDGRHGSAERGLLQQLILYTVITDRIPTRSAPNWRLLPDKKTAVIVFACRISVALSTSVEDMGVLLNTDAAPFVPQHLNTLFDQPPALHHADLPPLDPLFKARNMVGDVCSWTKPGSPLLASPPVTASPPAHANQGMTQKLRHTPGPSTSSGPQDSEYLNQIRKYSRLLILEETAMEDQIRRYDMFNIRCQFAVFEQSVQRPQYRLHTGLPNRHSDFEAAAHKKDCRGPQLSLLYPDEDMTGCCPRRVLTVIEVPGLPEDRPSLKFGDTVHIRFADADTAEFTGYVIVTETSSCLVAMPKQFYACCVPTPRSFAENTTIEKLTGLSEEKIKGLDFGLLHVRFGFDRGAMKRMHEALSSAKTNLSFHCLPPAIAKEESPSLEIAGLPSDEDFFAAVGNNLPANSTIHGNGPSIFEVRQKVNTISILGRQQLNQEQRWAIASFLAASDANCPFTIYGPPGTGKTVTLVECALQIVKTEPNSKVLMCAPQGYSADLLASALGQAGISPSQMMRLADPRHPPPQMKHDVFDRFSNFDERLRAFGLPPAAEVASKQVIIMTCGAAGILRCGDYKEYNEHSRRSTNGCPALSFTHVLVDEAGQALIPEVLVPLSLLQPKSGKAVLCGDPKQLGPVVRSLHAAMGVDGNGLSRSLLEVFLEYNAASADTKKRAGSVPATATLVRNYRSHHTLLELPNKLFYNGQLVAAADQSTVQPPVWSLTAPPPPEPDPQPVANGEDTGPWAEILGIPTDSSLDQPLEPEAPEEPKLPPSTVFYGVRGQQLREGEAPSFFNALEAELLVTLLETLLNEQKTLPPETRIGIDDIGVIATYRKQVQKIRLLLRVKRLGGIRVGTVDDLQGQEQRVIFISTVLSKPESLPPMTLADGGDLQVGFWRNPRRFNVATTRAKALLVVVGHPLVLPEDPCWRELLKYCKENGSFKGAGQQGISQLISSRETEEKGKMLRPDDSPPKQVAYLVNRKAEMALLGADAGKSEEESLAAYQSEVQWRLVL